MANPIRSVLSAEQSAQEQIGEARSAAEAAVKHARQRARSMIERSEIRTQQAVLRFERQRNRELINKIHQIRKRHRRQLQRQVVRLDAGLDDMVEEIVKRFWPG